MRTALALTNIAATQLFGENRKPAHFERARTIIHFNEQDRRLTAMMTTAQGGSRSAFEKLVRAATPFIKSVARRLGVPADFIDDVVQETLLTIHCIRHIFDPNRPFTPWLRMIAQRRAIDVLRRHIRTTGREIHEPLAFQNYSDPAGNPEEAMDQSDRKSALALAIAALPVKQREAAEQLALNGRSLADASATTGRTQGALKVNFHRALDTLRADQKHIFVKSKA
jgi:RNA polymerase sigma factor (sigma-70 family)